MVESVLMAEANGKVWDDRVPVRFGSGEAAELDAALLVEGDAPVPPGHAVGRFRLTPSLIGHPFGCACCTPRGPVAEALGRLFLARARGEVTFFRSVVVVTATPAVEAAVRAALAEDQVSAGRFRLAER
jgi:hypothetical protein